MNGNNNQQGRANQRPRANQQVNPQAQIGPQIQPQPRHPANDLDVAGGVIASIRSSLRFSESAVKSLRDQLFSHLFVDKSGSRFYVGDQYGFKDHEHALGAFIRSHFDNLIMYKYQMRGRILEPGASPVRSCLRYNTIDGIQEPWLKRLHLMNPVIGPQDEIRKTDHLPILQEAAARHRQQELLKPLNQQWLWTVNEQTGNLSINQCNHTMQSIAPIQGNCACTERFDAIKSVESFYYPGVQQGIHSRLAGWQNESVGGVAWVVFNDYYLMLLKMAKEERFSEQKTHLTTFAFSDLIGKAMKMAVEGKACVGIDNEPESRHLINYEEETGNRELKVKAVVKGNPIPYHHGIVLTTEAPTFGVEFSSGNETFLMIYTRKECFWNGDVPTCLYKIQVTKKSSYTKEQLQSVPVVRAGYATVDDLMNDTNLVSEAFEKVGRNIHAAEEKARLDANQKGTPKEDEPEVPLVLFDEDKYERKLTSGIDRRAWPLELKTRVESNRAFVRWLKRQFQDRNTSHTFSLRYISGEAYLCARKLNRSFWGLIVSESKDLTAMAKLEDVLQAYLKIGVKSNTTSIQQALVTHQRDMKTVDHTALVMGEAYIIARLLRTIEAKRFETLVLVEA